VSIELGLAEQSKGQYLRLRYIEKVYSVLAAPVAEFDHSDMDLDLNPCEPGRAQQRGQRSANREVGTGILIRTRRS
jgi:hypothetical protein